MKFEHIFVDARYLAPNAYGGIRPSYEKCKIKQLKKKNKNPISFNQLKVLLNKDKYKDTNLEIKQLEIKQDKQYRNSSDGIKNT